MLERVFVGNSSHKLDDKARLFLPAKFREGLTEEVVIAPSQEHCLAVWSMPGFAKYCESLLSESPTDRKVRDFVRFLSHNSALESVDKQGRVGLKPALREWAGLDREVLITGAINHAEIWEPTRWHTLNEGNKERFANLDGPISGGMSLPY